MALTKDEILDGIAEMSVLELSELLIQRSTDYPDIQSLVLMEIGDAQPPAHIELWQRLTDLICQLLR